MRGRLALGAVGVVVAGYGVWLLVSRSSTDQLRSVVTWLVGGVVVHDAVLAPLVLVAGWLALRPLPAWVRGPVACGALVLGTLTVLAVPVLGGWGRRGDNPTLLDRDYVAGWWVVALVVLAGVVVGCLVVRSRTTGGHHGARSGRR